MYIRQRIPARPTIRFEKELAAKYNAGWVAGVDEAGRGPLAGPVVAAAVILPFDARRPVGLRDSKQLNAKTRDRLFAQIQRMAVSSGIGIATAQEIDLLNILEATRLAASRAISALDPQPGVLLTDALEIPRDTRPVFPLIKADQISASVSAASILAKVTRDRLMDAYAIEFPEFNWTSNRGYPTADHYAAIEEHGPCNLHRLSFRGVGFFAIDPRRSPSYYSFRAALDAFATQREQSATDTVADLVGQISAARDRLPPPDYEELQRIATALVAGER